jgi:CRISPR/Cas system-associated endonuclease Cas1
LDLIEEFRVPIVDSAIVPLFYDKKMRKEDLETQNNQKD